MRCPNCGSLNDKVVDTRQSKDGSVIRRRRECLDCGQERLKKIDPVAYLRFRSVYNEFQDIKDFEKALKEIEEKEEK